MTFFTQLVAFFNPDSKIPKIKGTVGENRMNKSLERHLNENYCLIKDVTLPTEDGSTQIDHIVVSIYGVFVIETKNMEGWIFGGGYQKDWTQKNYRHSEKFQNPLRQNTKHVKILESLLEMDILNLFSIVAFVGGSEFKTPMPDNVTDRDGCIKYIKSKNRQVLTETEVKEIVDKIEDERKSRSSKTDREHNKHVKNIKAENEHKRKARAEQVKNTTAKKEAKDSTICPRCGNPLVEREAKRGENKGGKFWGCSSYPRCRYKADIT